MALDAAESKETRGDLFAPDVAHTLRLLPERPVRIAHGKVGERRGKAILPVEGRHGAVDARAHRHGRIGKR